MTLQEKFDSIADSIEFLISDREHDIPEALARQTGLNLRLLSDSFQFITDMTLIKYIRQRRLVHALAQRIHYGLSVEQIISDAGFSDAAAFSKACKNEFQLTPSQITEGWLENYPPLSFDKIITDKGVGQLKQSTSIDAGEKKSCGITSEQFAIAKQIINLGAVYGFSDEEAEFAYHLSESCQITPTQAFDFYDDFKLQMENGSFMGEYSLTDLAELSCKYNLSFSQSQEIMHEIGCHGYSSFHSLPDGFFDIYFSEYNEQFGGFSVPLICQILEVLEDNDLSVDDFEDIMSYAMVFGDNPIETIEKYRETQEDFIEMEFKEGFEYPPKDDTEGFSYRSIWEIPEN